MRGPSIHQEACKTVLRDPQYKKQSHFLNNVERVYIMEKTNTITQYFEADHSRLDAIFRQFQRVKQESVEDSKLFFRLFNNGLKRHIIWEEDILFPAFEKKTGMTAEGPTWVMREEHRQIGSILERIHEKVRRGDPLGADDEMMLVKILNEHNQKEEQVLYPALDRLLTEEESARIFLGMENIPAERYQTCCGGAREH